MPSAIDPYQHLLGEVPDEKIAEMAGVKPETVAAYRRKVAEEPAPEPKAAEPDDEEPEPEIDARTRGLADAAQALLDQGWRLRDGQLVPPPRPVETERPRLVIRLRKAMRFDVPSKRTGRPVTIVQPKSIYRGAMAEKVYDIARRTDQLHLIERLSG